MERKIIHVDMDAFYASIEEREDPSLKGKPVVVGGSPYKRGVVATANYEARKFGIRSAISAKAALELCPHAVFIRPRFEIYKEASEIIRSVFSEFTDRIEPLSLDEAYLDVTEIAKSRSSTKEIAKEIKDLIYQRTQLTSSAGVASNKLVAKIASDFKKPDGLTVVSPKYVNAFLDPLPVRTIPGVGPVTEVKLQQKKITKISELRRLSELDLVTHFGKTGSWLYQASRGIDERPVQSSRIRKSLSVEDTFEQDIFDIESIRNNLLKIAETLSFRLKEKSIAGKTVTLKVTFSDFSKITRAVTIDERTSSAEILFETTANLIEINSIHTKAIRLLGIGVSNFENPPQQAFNKGHMEYQLSFDFSF